MSKQRPCGAIYTSRVRRVEAVQYDGDPQAVMYFVGKDLPMFLTGSMDTPGGELKKGQYLLYEDKKFSIMSKHDFDLVFREPPLKITCRSCQTGAEHSN